MSTIRRLDRYTVTHEGESLTFVVERLLASEAESLDRSRAQLLEDKAFEGVLELGTDFVLRYARDIEVFDDAKEYLPPWPGRLLPSEQLSAEHYTARRAWLDGVVSTFIPAAILKQCLEMKQGNLSALVVSGRSPASSPGPELSSALPSDAGSAPTS